MLPSEKLAELGLELPAVATPVAAYVPAVIDRGVVRTSGQIPVVNGEPVCIGAVGEDGADPEDAKDAARVCALNALAAAEGVVVPVQAEYYALEGVAGLLATLEEVRAGLNPSLRLLGILVTMYDGRTLLAQQVEAQLRAHFGEKVFWTVIPRNVRLAEAPSFGKTIAQHAPTSPGAHAYRRLAEEVMARVQEA